jgi:hypothetical protein
MLAEEKKESCIHNHKQGTFWEIVDPGCRLVSLLGYMFENSFRHPKGRHRLYQYISGLNQWPLVTLPTCQKICLIPKWVAYKTRDEKFPKMESVIKRAYVKRAYPLNCLNKDRLCICYRIEAGKSINLNSKWRQSNFACCKIAWSTREAKPISF